MGGLKLAYYVSILYIKNNYYMSCRAILRYVTTYGQDFVQGTTTYLDRGGKQREMWMSYELVITKLSFYF